MALTVWTYDWVPEGPRGFVRDLLLNVRNLDVDILVEPDGIALAQAVTLALTGGSLQRIPREAVIRSGGAGTAWLLLFLALSIGGAILWSMRAVRAALGAP